MPNPANELRERREMLRWSRQRLAEEAAISISSVVLAERGDYQAQRPRALPKIHAALAAAESRQDNGRGQPGRSQEER